MDSLQRIGGLAIVVSMLAIIGLSATFINRVSTAVTTLSNRTDVSEFVAAHCYEAIRNRDYAAAFGDLDSQATLNGQPLYEAAFIKQAIDADAQRGSLFSYGLLKQSDAATPTATEFNANLRRGNQSYLVHLQVRQVGNRWKISSIDGL